jgi:undecaprenyl-diphosphatase
LNFDTALLHQVIQLRRPWLDDVMLLSSALGAAGFIWWVTALITMVFPDKRMAAYRMLLAGFLTWGISEFILKPVVDRARPFEVESSLTVIDAKPVSRSFPSGHAAMAFAYAVGGARMIPGSAWVWWPLAVIVAVSRVYVGVHWPSDIIGGAAIGLACAWFVLGGRQIGTTTLPRPAK